MTQGLYTVSVFLSPWSEQTASRVLRLAAESGLSVDTHAHEGVGAGEVRLYAADEPAAEVLAARLGESLPGLDVRVQPPLAPGDFRGIELREDEA